jgi:hypothetical protein
MATTQLLMVLTPSGLVATVSGMHVRENKSYTYVDGRAANECFNKVAASRAC